MASMDETYGGEKYGKHPLDGELSPELWTTAMEWGLVRSLHGHKVVLTGTMSMPRVQLASMITALGGLYCDTVPASGVYVLVHAEGAAFGRKMQTATDRGGKVMSERKFIRYLLASVEELEDGVTPQTFDQRVAGYSRAS